MRAAWRPNDRGLGELELPAGPVEVALGIVGRRIVPTERFVSPASAQPAWRSDFGTGIRHPDSGRALRPPSARFWAESLPRVTGTAFAGTKRQQGHDPQDPSGQSHPKRIPPTPNLPSPLRGDSTQRTEGRRKAPFVSSTLSLGGMRLRSRVGPTGARTRSLRHPSSWR